MTRHGSGGLAAVRSGRFGFREEAEGWDRLDDDALARLFDNRRSLAIRVRRPPVVRG